MAIFLLILFTIVITYIGINFHWWYASVLSFFLGILTYRFEQRKKNLLWETQEEGEKQAAEFGSVLFQIEGEENGVELIILNTEDNFISSINFSDEKLAKEFCEFLIR